MEKYTAQNLSDSSTKGPEDDQYTQTGDARNKQETVTRNYDLPQNASDSLNGFFEKINAPNVNPTQNHQERAGLTKEQKLKRGAATAAEIATPIVVGVAAREITEKAFGVAGGPIAAAVAGAATGGIRGFLKVRKIDAETGKGAKEFYQKEVSGKEKDIAEGGTFKRLRARVSKYFNGLENIAVRGSFKVDDRAKIIAKQLEDAGIDLNDRDLLNKVIEVFGREKGIENMQRLLTSMQTQALLSGFSEEKDDDEMAKKLDATSVITFAFIEVGKAQEAEDALESAHEQVKQAITSLQKTYTLASAASRAIKSAIYYEAITNIAGLISKAKEGIDAIQEHNSAIAQLTEHQEQLGNLENQYNQIQPQYEQSLKAIEELQNQRDSLSDQLNALHQATQNTHIIPESISLEHISIDDHINTVLEQTAHKQGFETVQQYVAAGGQERILRVEGIKQIYEQLKENPDLLQKVNQTAKDLGVSPNEVLYGLMSRAPYDLQETAIAGVNGYNIESIASWLDQVKENNRVLASLKQGIDITYRTEAKGWRDVMDGLLKVVPEHQQAVDSADLSAIANLEAQVSGIEHQIETQIRTQANLTHKINDIQARYRELYNLVPGLKQDIEGEREALQEIVKSNWKKTIAVLPPLALADWLAGYTKGIVRFGVETNNQPRVRSTTTRTPTPTPSPTPPVSPSAATPTTPAGFNFATPRKAAGFSAEEGRYGFKGTALGKNAYTIPGGGTKEAVINNNINPEVVYPLKQNNIRLSAKDDLEQRARAARENALREAEKNDGRVSGEKLSSTDPKVDKIKDITAQLKDLNRQMRDPSLTNEQKAILQTQVDSLMQERLVLRNQILAEQIAKRREDEREKKLEEDYQAEVERRDARANLPQSEDVGTISPKEMETLTTFQQKQAKAEKTQQTEQEPLPNSVTVDGVVITIQDVATSLGLKSTTKTIQKIWAGIVANPQGISNLKSAKGISGLGKTRAPKVNSFFEQTKETVAQLNQRVQTLTVRFTTGENAQYLQEVQQELNNGVSTQRASQIQYELLERFSENTTEQPLEAKQGDGSIPF